MLVFMLGHFSCVQLFVTLWNVALQAPLSIGFSRQEYWSGLLCPPLGNLSDPWIEPMSLTSLALAGGFFNHYCRIYIDFMAWDSLLMLIVSI